VQLWLALAHYKLHHRVPDEPLARAGRGLLRLAALLPPKHIGLRWLLLDATTAILSLVHLRTPMESLRGSDAAGIKGRLLELVSELQLDEGLDQLVGCSAAGWAGTRLLPYDWRRQALGCALTALQLVFGEELVLADAQAIHLPYLLNAGLAPEGSKAPAPGTGAGSSGSGASTSLHGWLLECSRRGLLHFCQRQAIIILAAILKNSSPYMQRARALSDEPVSHAELLLYQQHADQLWDLVELPMTALFHSDQWSESDRQLLLCPALEDLCRASTAVTVRCLNAGLLAAAVEFTAAREYFAAPACAVCCGCLAATLPLLLHCA
jgi:hypothetical protein